MSQARTVPVYLRLSPRLALKAGASSAGRWLGMVNGGGIPSGHVFAQAGLGAQFMRSPLIDVGFGDAYRYDLGLYEGLEVTASTSLFLSGREGRRTSIECRLPVRPAFLGAKTPGKGRGIELANTELHEVFPVFHKLHDDHAVGMVTLTDKEKVVIRDVKVSFLAKYLNSARTCPAPAELGPGERTDVQIMSILTDRVPEVTEATKAAADIPLENRMDSDLRRGCHRVSCGLPDGGAAATDRGRGQRSTGA